MQSFLEVLAVVTVILLIVSVAANVWKHGSWGIVSLLTLGAIFWVCMLWLYYLNRGHLGLKEIGIAALMYLFFVYLFGIKYVMKIGFLELAPHEKYKNYLRDNNVRGLFPSFIVYLGPSLFFCMLGLLIYAVILRIKP